MKLKTFTVNQFGLKFYHLTLSYKKTEMIRTIHIFAGFSLLLALIFMTSCQKDKSMEATVVVRYMADTSKVVPDARVYMHRGDVEVTGYTNNYGEYRHTFDLPIQLEIEVTKDTLKGIGIINLAEPGEDVSKTIYIF